MCCCARACGRVALLWWQLRAFVVMGVLVGIAWATIFFWVLNVGDLNAGQFLFYLWFLQELEVILCIGLLFVLSVDRRVTRAREAARLSRAGPLRRKTFLGIPKKDNDVGVSVTRTRSRGQRAVTSPTSGLQDADDPNPGRHKTLVELRDVVGSAPAVTVKRSSLGVNAVSGSVPSHALGKGGGVHSHHGSVSSIASTDGGGSVSSATTASGGTAASGSASGAGAGVVVNPLATPTVSIVANNVAKIRRTSGVDRAVSREGGAASGAAATPTTDLDVSPVGSPPKPSLSVFSQVRHCDGAACVVLKGTTGVRVCGSHAPHTPCPCV